MAAYASPHKRQEGEGRLSGRDKQRSKLPGGEGREYPKYYTFYDQHGIDRFSGHVSGDSLYKALAKAIIGDFEQHELIKQAVMHFVIYVRANVVHPLHVEYMQREVAFQATTGLALFAVLECPDLLPCEQVYWVVAHALEIRLRIYATLTAQGEARDLYLVLGASNATPCALLCRPSRMPLAAQFSALIPDRTSKDLVEYLQTTHGWFLDPANYPLSHGLQMQRLSWAASDSGSQVRCFNGFRSDSRLQDLEFGNSSRLCRLDTQQMVVSEPLQIPIALEIITRALERDSSQGTEIRVSKDCRRGILSPHVSADTEMARLPRSVLVGKSQTEIDEMVATGEVELLVSVLTISVGGRLFIHFNVLNMLENPSEYTVPALEALWRATIFNTNLLMLFWNLQYDMVAIDSTVAHMYQGTPRPSYLHIPWGQDTSVSTTPTFKLSSEFFGGVRPLDLEFSRVEQECDLHASGLSEQGFACPCTLRNVDISPLLSHFCRQHGKNGVEKLRWTHARQHVKFDMLIETAMQQDRMLPILRQLKDAVARSGQSAFDFYQSLGQPGMELNDNVMGYLSGDADVPGRVLRHFVCSNDGAFTGSILANWANLPQHGLLTVLRQLPQKISPFGAVGGGVTLFEDHPIINKHCGGPVFDATHPIRSHFQTEAPAIASLKQWQHDRVVALMRMNRHDGKGITPCQPQRTVYEPMPEKVTEAIDQRKRALLGDLTDPSWSWLPLSCATLVDDHLPRPVLRANQTSYEALVEFLRSSGYAMNALPPPGFGSPPGHPMGLPIHLDIVPGRSLTAGRNILEAHTGLPAFFANPFLGLRAALAAPNRIFVPQELGSRHLAQVALNKTVAIIGEWNSNKTVLHAAQASNRHQVEEEVRLNEELGRPSFVDLTDLLDPEGRDYRHRVKRTPAWNRPSLLHTPDEWENGQWVSRATLTLEALEKAEAEGWLRL